MVQAHEFLRFTFLNQHLLVSLADFILVGMRKANYFTTTQPTGFCAIISQDDKTPAYAERSMICR
jgi:hypothetical protein